MRWRSHVPLKAQHSLSGARTKPWVPTLPPGAMAVLGGLSSSPPSWRHVPAERSRVPVFPESPCWS